MTPIDKLRGVGPALARILQENGVQSVEDLAGMEEAGLRRIPGIGTNRAASLGALARKAASAGAADSPDGDGGKPVNGKPAEPGADALSQPAQEEMDKKLAEAEAARKAAEEKAAKAKAKAAKAKRKAANLAEEFAAAKIKAKLKAKKMKAKAKKAIEKEKAKAQAILEGKTAGKKKKKAKK
ncbi:helix-hairpin-helix domain-containing protein [Leisingera sp. D0M16]|uniref:helix-hairpin-helix domain-containing protein n=1 Tax=Leisingera coralii TaxID=3351347 RepID=UPI003B824AF2